MPHFSTDFSQFTCPNFTYQLVVIEQSSKYISLTWKQTAISYGKLNFDVHSIGHISFNERRPQPIVHVIISYITDYVGPPINAFLEICKRLLHPLKQKKNSLIHINK